MKAIENTTSRWQLKRHYLETIKAIKKDNFERGNNSDNTVFIGVISNLIRRRKERCWTERQRHFLLAAMRPALSQRKERQREK